VEELGFCFPDNLNALTTLYICLLRSVRSAKYCRSAGGVIGLTAAVLIVRLGGKGQGVRGSILNPAFD
jgi:hypothetical protein